MAVGYYGVLCKGCSFEALDEIYSMEAHKKPFQEDLKAKTLKHIILLKRKIILMLKFFIILAVKLFSSSEQLHCRAWRQS